MKASSIKIWLRRSVLIIAALTMGTFLWVDYQIDQLWGDHTVVVDHTQFGVPQQKIVIRDVSVLSPDGNTMIADQTVIIDQGKIIALGSELNVPIDAMRVNGEGKYLIPGLIDSHVHLWQSPNDLLLYLANGVTHIRELNGSELHLQWKQELHEGRLGPRLFVASGRINSNGVIKAWFSHWTSKDTSVNTINDAERLVKSISDKGYDAVKVYTFLDPQDYLAINAAAKRIGIPVLGHTPISADLDLVWNSTQQELAHVEELVKALIREFGRYDETTAGDFLKYVESRSNELVNHLSENGMAVVSTLWLMESFVQQKFDLDGILNTVELAYANPGITEGVVITSRAMGWLPGENIYRIPEDLSAKRKQYIRVYWQTYAQAHRILLNAMLDKGVTVLAGTDANVPVTVPGFSLHDELQSLTNAGLSPAQALHTATVAPSDWMSVRSGKITVGYNADLVLLDGNPLKNISNTKKIEAVISKGRYLDRQRLDDILNAVKSANDQSRSVNISQHN